MRINHNIAALNTYRQLTQNSTAGSKSLEKLSSGLRINRAGDDAAGLAISEKMRAQIRGLNQAQRNAQDGISMIQTTEGALNEAHSILQRMRELAAQAANDTNVDVDRAEIQKELNQLTSEINRIGNTTEFNTQKLLNGGGADVTTRKTGGVLEVPTALSGGVGATGPTTQQSVTYTITTDLTDIPAKDAADGKTITFSFGDESITLTLNKGLNKENSTASQVGIGNITDDPATAQDELAASIESALQKALAERTDIAANYEVSIASGNQITIAAKAYSFSNGEAEGLHAGINSKINMQASAGIEYTEAQTAGSGSFATATIDFTGKSASDLVGTSLIIDGKEIAFYNSAEGSYTGNAEFKVNLNGAGNSEAIVDRIVKELYNGTGATNTKGGHAAAAGASYLANVDVMADPDNASKLFLVASTAGGEGNAITVEYNSPVKVDNLVGSNRLTGEKVNYASGLADGQHTVRVTYNAASANVGNQANQGAADLSITVDTSTIFDSGTYRLVGTATADVAQLQKLGADGNWSTVAGYDNISLTGGADNTIGDITLSNYVADDFQSDADFVEFTINQQGYSVALKEAGDTNYGADVYIRSGETNVTLNAYDGVGSVNVDIGTISSDLAVGANTTFTFTSEAGDLSEEVIGGTFNATFQIGANTGQSMTISIGDMRARALGISGAASGGTVEAQNGSVASYTAIQSVTNGTNNDSVEYALDISTSEKASAAISVINDAIEKVSAQRSQLGAFQNRLEHTINNLGTSSENLVAAESRIRDVDMASEMMEFTKNNILSQAAQAMLAQANQQPQGVLQLLR